MLHAKLEELAPYFAEDEFLRRELLALQDLVSEEVVVPRVRAETTEDMIFPVEAGRGLSRQVEKDAEEAQEMFVGRGLAEESFVRSEVNNFE